MIDSRVFVLLIGHVMNKLPFSAYDFFGYLISGTIILVMFDNLIDQDLLKDGDLTAPQFAFWTMVAYACGHILATPAQVLIERLVTRRLLGHPTAIILGIKKGPIKKLIFPGYFQQLPDSTCTRILSKLPQDLIKSSPEAIFYAAFSVSKTQSDTFTRMNSFLNMYGFSRNLSFASFLVLIVLSAVDLFQIRNIDSSYLIAACVSSLGLFYRYLKFYRLYTHECLMGFLSRETMREK